MASTSLFGGQSYTFSLMDDVTVNVVDKKADFNEIKVYEGTYITTNFTIDAYNPNQKFILPNSKIDTSSIRVVVKPSVNSNVSRKYRQANSLFNIDGDSAVYWVQEIESLVKS